MSGSFGNSIGKKGRNKPIYEYGRENMEKQIQSPMKAILAVIGRNEAMKKSFPAAEEFMARFTEEDDEAITNSKAVMGTTHQQNLLQPSVVHWRNKGYNNSKVHLSCEPGKKMTNIKFASFGIPKARYDGLRFRLQRTETVMFWPNNKSRMYILENTGEFVRSHDLHLGDFIMLFKDDEKDRYVILRKKAANGGQPEQDILIYLHWLMAPDLAFGMNCAFSADLSMSFPEEKLGNASAMDSTPS
ncbi:hypothetical protein HPP92_008914 [Vanilla planifolia]|uniref:TF-B3 domain-containing protein n=1 Tax=Vanilla planifolia TaxID=51239 RepID=A0A835V475_VANPL|nr:hypothetical protein HPP92_008914 [Vanilla planifolia]